MKIKESVTNRGFKKLEFKDNYGVKCNIQESSMASEYAIWIGAKDIGLKKCVKGSGRGWQDVKTKCTDKVDYIANNRMHLTQDEVKALLPILTRFAETGLL